MKYEIKLSKSAFKTLESINEPDYSKIKSRILNLAI